MLAYLVTYFLGFAESKCAGYDCLKEYVDKPDSNFAWTDTGIRLQGIDPIHLRLWNGYVLNFTSQAWLTPEGSFFENDYYYITKLLPIPNFFLNFTSQVRFAPF